MGGAAEGIRSRETKPGRSRSPQAENWEGEAARFRWVVDRKPLGTDGFGAPLRTLEAATTRAALLFVRTPDPEALPPSRTRVDRRGLRSAARQRKVWLATLRHARLRGGFGLVTDHS